MQVSLESGEISKIKSLSKVHHLIKIESLLTPEKSWKLLKARQRKTTKPIQKFDKRRGRSPLSERPAWRRHSMWWLLTQHFGLQGRQHHHHMKVDNFTLQRNNDGNKFLTFAEGPTKTRQGGLVTRLVTPKMLTTWNEEWCPAMLFKRYLEKRPREMEKSCPFYLPVINKSVSSIWYKKTPIGGHHRQNHGK